MGAELTCNWQRQWGKRELKGSESLSRGGRTQSRSILRRYQFWTSVGGPLGGRERGCLRGGGCSLASTLRGKIIGRQRQQWSRSWSWSGSRSQSRTQTRTRADRRSQGERAVQVELSGVGRKSNPPRMTTGRKHGRGKKVGAKLI